MKFMRFYLIYPVLDKQLLFIGVFCQFLYSSSWSHSFTKHFSSFSIIFTKFYIIRVNFKYRRCRFNVFFLKAWLRVISSYQLKTITERHQSSFSQKCIRRCNNSIGIFHFAAHISTYGSRNEYGWKQLCYYINFWVLTSSLYCVLWNLFAES